MDLRHFVPNFLDIPSLFRTFLTSTASQNRDNREKEAKNTLVLALAITAEEDIEGWKKEGYHSSEDMLLLKGPS